MRASPVNYLSVQDFKTACDVSGIYEEAAVWLSENFITGPIESINTTRVGLLTESSKAKELCLASFFVFVDISRKRYNTDENVTVIDGNTLNFDQGH